ncbi:Na+/H+ antiporter NhaC family protein [Halorubrum distributum]|uniref:Na+/H+ antiporter NhaC n=2 Tax=Halorubrum distributum TaxID=29283 RepID=M0D3P1_9EURY|nr:Na+/H+ antiporter NhaC family protein [Halorubrum terrestre]ELZ30141.1 Na+/H+ antiporter NhaC [Halorubrum terrestre JCM 10247]MYL15391.1 Na+/H+ antiporter NhaC family protein [Halorubrum terrestre]MYL66638.1 Na+/H+ antiporter NhaC family protein [Halorubrum terrestre]PHQ46023.1 sodium:proton antiporter [Halorubrum sp. C3]
MSEFGALSIVPPLLAIALAILTRKAILSLFLGIWSGAVIYTGGLGIVQTFDWIVAAIIADDGFQATILVFTLLLGSGVALVWNLGGTYAIRDWAIERLDTQRKAGLAAWVLGIVLFFDDYANTAIVGSAMKDVSDQLRISREKLSYIVDSTAAPVATLGISSWVAFQLSLIEEGYAEAGVAAANRPSTFEVFLSSIPFNMYAILAIAMVAIVVLWGRDYGEMLTAEHRSWTTGRVTREGAEPMQDVAGELGEPPASTPRLINFFAPVGVLIVVTVATAFWSGGFAPTGFLSDLLAAQFGSAGDRLWNAVINADFATALMIGAFGMVLSGFVLGKVYRVFGFGDATEYTVDGFGIMLTAVSILVLAWGIGEVISALETGQYVAEATVGTVPQAVLPALVMVVAGFIAFSTGTSWGTMGIMTPIAVPIAWEVTGGGAEGHTLVAVMVGVIFSGAIFGDHSSPISDTTVLSATFTGADLIDHVRTQIYYAVTVGLVSVALLLVWGFLGITPFVLLPVGVLILVALVYLLSEFDANRRGIDPVSVSEPQEPEADTISVGGSEKRE